MEPPEGTNMLDFYPPEPERAICVVSSTEGCENPLQQQEEGARARLGKDASPASLHFNPRVCRPFPAESRPKQPKCVKLGLMVLFTSQKVVVSYWIPVNPQFPLP